MLGNAAGSEAGTWNYRVQHDGVQLQLLRTTVTAYYPNAALHLVNFPAQVRVYNGAFDPANPLVNCQAETRTVYDDLNGAYTSPPTSGLVAKTQQALTACSTTAALDLHDPQWQETRFNYNVYGNQTVRHLVGGGATDDWLNTAYDEVYQLFPVRQWLGQAPSFQETAQYYGVNGPAVSAPNAYWGALAAYCAVNQVCTRQGYDAFGRRTQQWTYVSPTTPWNALTADNAAAQWSYYSPTNQPGQSALTITEWDNPRPAGNFTRKVYNGLGQLVQTQTPNQAWSQEVVVDYAYDALGQQSQVSVPHFVERYSKLPADLRRPADFSQGQTTTTYDALGRPLRSTAPNGQVTAYTYAGRASAQWAMGRLGDATNKVVKRNDLDGLGNLQFIRTYAWHGTTPYPEGVITQTHDVVGNLTRVEQANGLGVTTLRYDLAGHKTSMTDVDMGHWTYTYDRQGKLTQQTDACGNTTTLTYEAVLQRVSRKSFTQGGGCATAAPSANVVYAYDTALTARGQLIGVAYTDDSYAKALTYNDWGLLASTTLTVSGTSYTTQVGYDAYQRPLVTTQPNGEQVSVAYNGLGLPNQLASQVLGATLPQTLVNAVNYDAAGRLTQMAFPAGGNVVRTQSYAPFNQPDNNGGQLQSIQVQNPTSTLLNLSYQYDSYGNIKTLTDGSTSSPFTYDDQNRLTSAYDKNYAYDPAGRLTTYENATTTHDPHVPVHAVKQVNLPGTSNSQPTLTVRAWGVAANGVWPVMELWVNHQKISSWSVTATAQDYSAPVTLSGRDVVDVLFTNDYVDDHVDRNLRVESLQVDDQAPLPARRGVYDLSVDGPDQAAILAAAFDDRDVYPGQTPMNWNGALRFVLGAGAARYGYDANGNRRYTLSASQADVYTYDVENRLHTVERNDTVLERYLYDETGQRLLKSTSTLTTTYVSSAYEVADGVATTYYSFNGQRVGMRKGSVLTYLHADHLGSTLFATDSSGNVVDNNQPRYFAYGRERTASLAALPTDYTFTGQKQDGSGLIYMNARYYDPQTGQFISPDDLIPDPTTLSAHNRFMYVNGNPLRYNDPSGHVGPVAAPMPTADPWQAVLDALKLVGSGVSLTTPIVAVVGVAGLGGMMYGLGETTDALPSVPALYPAAGIGNGNINITIPVPGSTTLTSGVPLTPGAQTQSTGATAINQPTQTIVEPLPAQQKGSNIVVARKYSSSKKHEPGGWGTMMDLSDSTAQEVLNNGIEAPNGKQVYGYYNGQLYEFEPDNVGGYHGFPIPGNQAPTAILRMLRNAGTISNAVYNKLIQGK